MTVLECKIRVAWADEEHARREAWGSLPVPKHKSEGAAGIDLYAAAPGQLQQGQQARIPTGMCFELPAGSVGLVFMRGGASETSGLHLTNAVGVLDCDFRGELKLLVTADRLAVWQRGERFAQLVVLSYVPMLLEVVPELSLTRRGAGGFGSTGRDG